MKGLHRLLEGLATCQHQCFPMRCSHVLYLLQCIRSYFIKIQDPPLCLGDEHRNTQKCIAGIMGLDLVSFCRWKQLTCTCLAQAAQQFVSVAVTGSESSTCSPLEQLNKPLWKLPLARLWFCKWRSQHLHWSKGSGLFKLDCRAKLQDAPNLG